MEIKKLSKSKWVISLLLISFTIILSMACFVYYYDPFCYYRIPVSRLIVNNYRFINAGLAKNATYDTAIIGSSMTQNFHMDKFRKELNMNPIKLSVGGMSVEGTNLTYDHLMQIGKVEKLIFCIDIPSLNKEVDSLESYPIYLYNRSKLDDYKYLLGYETWSRLLPLNIGFNILEKNGFVIPNFYGTHSIDTVGEWDNEAKFGEEYLKTNYLKNKHQVSAQNLENASERMKSNVDRLFSNILSKRGPVEIIFFFPPYSALYWYDSQQKEYYRIFQEIKKYIVDSFSRKKGVRIFDFQSIPQIINLNNYKDITHYSGDINDLMVSLIANEEYLVNTENIEKYIEDLNLLILKFADENEWVKKIN